MNYELLHSFQKQKHKKKVQSRYNFTSLSRYIEQQSPQTETKHQFSYQSPMPIKLIHYKSQSRTLPDQSESQNKQQKLRYKIKHRKINLPKVDKRQQKIKTIINSYQPSTHQSFKKRVRTYTDVLEDPEEALIRISQIYERIKDCRKSKINKQSYKYKQQNQREKDQIYNLIKLQNNTKQREYENYVSQLQNKFRARNFPKSMPQQVQIQQKLMNRIETKKYIYCKPFNPEVKQILNQLQQSSLSHSKLAKNTVKQQIQEPQTNMQIDQDQKIVNRQRNRNAINYDFIKILRKAKNRGASLLIKLKKYPSRKLIGK